MRKVLVVEEKEKEKFEVALEKVLGNKTIEITDIYYSRECDLFSALVMYRNPSSSC